MNPGAFRLLLAFVVVIHHSFPLRLGGVAVGLFFVLSGYWIGRMWREKYVLQPSPYLSFLISRWWRLAPIYFAVHLVAIWLVAADYVVGDRSAYFNWAWWGTQPAIIGNAQYGRLLPPAWSLDVEMQFYVLAPLLIVGLAGMQRSGVTVLIAVVMGWGALRLSGPASLETPLIDVFLWLFLIGVASDRFQWCPGRRMVIGSACAACAFVAAVVIAPSTRSLLWRRSTDELDAMSMFGGDLLFILICVSAIPLTIRTAHQASGHWDRWLGDLSYPLYLFHWIPRDWYYSQVDWSKPVWWNGSLLLANVVVALFGAIVLLHLIDRPAQRARATWFGSGVSRPDGLRLSRTKKPNR